MQRQRYIVLINSKVHKAVYLKTNQHELTSQCLKHIPQDSHATVLSAWQRIVGYDVWRIEATDD